MEIVQSIMNKYSNDKNALMLLFLMKEHGVRKVIASPGTTNLAIVGSMQHDDFFEMYSSVDERSAAYMACGLAAESGEAVAIICTGATASRNYLPALTEAYYRKLPILVIAGSHGEEVIGHLHSQVIDRAQAPKDTIKYSAYINPPATNKLEWSNNVQINTALIKLHQHGGGPVLINIVAAPGASFDVAELPKERVIKLYSHEETFPEMSNGKIAVFIGSHVQMSPTTQDAIDAFCLSRNAVVFCDHTSGYQGKYQVNFTLVNGLYHYDTELNQIDLLIHLGEVSGDTYTTSKLKAKEVWRVSEDGEVRDLFGKLTSVFELKEESFFLHYTLHTDADDSYLKACISEYEKVYSKIPNLGFGNITIAKFLAPRLPKNSVIHFGIYNSLRTWNLFRLDNSIQCSCNVGGFGIDGPTSTLIGASLATPNKLHFLNVGDLAFFYDLNALGNRHIGPNVRILLINNGRGVEFRKKDHPGSKFGAEADLYIAAGGHFGCQSTALVKHYAEDLGFEYMTADSIESLRTLAERFLTPEITEKPMLMEVFPSVENEVDNLDILRHSLERERTITDRLKDSAIGNIKGIVKGGLPFLKKS